MNKMNKEDLINIFKSSSVDTATLEQLDVWQAPNKIIMVEVKKCMHPNVADKICNKLKNVLKDNFIKNVIVYKFGEPVVMKDYVED